MNPSAPCASCSCSSHRVPVRACHVSSFSAKSDGGQGVSNWITGKLRFYHFVPGKCIGFIEGIKLNSGVSENT